MAERDDDWLRPWWLERQLDPTGPDVVPGPGALDNVTHRDWLLLGTVGAPDRAVVDPRGLVTPWPGGWSLDWWVGADDRWHLPSRSAAVRQALVGSSPVVATSMRVPGGDVVHRCWAVATEAAGSASAVVVEVENASPVPVAVALAVRPWNPVGAAPVGAIDLDGDVVVVDGRPAVVLPKVPSRVAWGDAGADAFPVVTSGAAADRWPDSGVRCSKGRANAAVLFPLPHTATVRVLLPLAPLRATAAARRRAPVEPVRAEVVRSAPAADRVAAGWDAATRRAPRLDLPDARLVEATDAARRFAALHTAGEDAVAWPPAVVGGLDTAELALALDRHGLHDEAERLLVGFADRQGLDGSFAGETQRIDAAGAWLHAVGEHVRLTGDLELGRALVGPLAKAAHHLQRRHTSRRARRAADAATLFPVGVGPSWLPSDAGATYHDALWARRGLLDAADVLHRVGQPDAAAQIAGFAAEVTGALDDALRLDGAGDGPVRVGPGGPVGAAGTLAALAETTGGYGEPASFVAALRAAVDQLEPALVDGAVWHEVGQAGLSPRLTAAAAVGQLRLSSPGALASLRWLLDAGAPTWGWPELVHPRTAGGCAGQGHHGPSTAAFLSMVRRLIVVERPDGLSLLPVVPEAWWGQALEVHQVPTAHGRLSFALRWHGERPALLWEIEPAGEASVDDEVALSLPGLDPGWRGTGPRGEALLAAPVPDPDAPPSGDGADPTPAPGDGGAPPARSAEPLPGAVPDPPDPPDGGGSSFT